MHEIYQILLKTKNEFEMTKKEMINRLDSGNGCIVLIAFSLVTLGAVDSVAA